MKRSAVDSSTSPENPKRKLRNRYDAESDSLEDAESKSLHETKSGFIHNAETVSLHDADSISQQTTTSEPNTLQIVTRQLPRQEGMYQKINNKLRESESDNVSIISSDTGAMSSQDYLTDHNSNIDDDPKQVKNSSAVKELAVQNFENATTGVLESPSPKHFPNTEREESNNIDAEHIISENEDKFKSDHKSDNPSVSAPTEEVSASIENCFKRNNEEYGNNNSETETNPVYRVDTEGLSSSAHQATNGDTNHNEGDINKEHNKDKNTDVDSEDEPVKEDESRCSGSDGEDRNYQVNVGLYGTDIMEDESTRDEGEGLSVPSTRHPDVNNNPCVIKEQLNKETQLEHLRTHPEAVCTVLSLGQSVMDEGSNTLDGCTRRILSLGQSLMDEGSNTVDGCTRRALEAQCRISDGSRDVFGKGNGSQIQHIEVLASVTDSTCNEAGLEESGTSEKIHNLGAKEMPEGKLAFPTDFSGVFKHSGDNAISRGMFVEDDPVPESYRNVYRQNVNGSQFGKASTPSILSPRYGAMISRPGMMNSPLNVDNMAAEQLASELVQTYSGENSHMIPDMLRRRTGAQFEDVAGLQTVIHEVDLLNTPQQLPPVDPDYNTDQCFGQCNGRVPPNFHNQQAIPETSYRRNTARPLPQELHGRLTYNDIQAYGGKWSAYKQQQQQSGHLSSATELTENPYPSNHAQSTYRPQCPPNAGLNDSPIMRYSSAYQQQTGPGPQSDSQQMSGTYPNAFNDYRQFNIDRPAVGNRQYRTPQGFPRRQHDGQMGFPPFSPDPLGLKGGVVNDGLRPIHEETKMTYTPRDVMETHLSQSGGQYQKSKVIPSQPISDVDYSSIYPTRDSLDRHLLSGNSYSHKKFDDPSPSRDKYNKHQPMKKRFKPSKYDTLPLKAPPMPIFDEMMSKYPPPFSSSKEMEPLNTQHKYVVVNPSQALEMPPKTLLLKYIDFLILENEQITDISQTPGAPDDIYVTEDMYFMDTLKYKVPFPSKKFVEWVSSFFPKLNFKQMKFKGNCAVPPAADEPRVSDPRPTQQVLEDTFYFFQRAIMNMEG